MRIARFVDQAEPTYGIVEGPADADPAELTVTALPVSYTHLTLPTILLV